MLLSAPLFATEGDDDRVSSYFTNEAPVIDGVLSFCEGENTALSLAPFANYKWSTGDNTASDNVIMVKTLAFMG